MTDQEYASELFAVKGEGWTNPNPMVGAVIVKRRKIIGKAIIKVWRTSRGT